MFMSCEFKTVVGYVLALASIAITVAIERRRRGERLHRQQRFEWAHIQEGVRQLCSWVLRDGFEPDLLIGIPGAGPILTALAVIQLGDRLPFFMAQQLPANSEATFPETGGFEVTTAKWRYWLPPEVLERADARVLVIDDYAQSGDTLTVVKKGLVNKGFRAKNVRTAALVSVHGVREAMKAPDYTWFWVDSYDVHMPWGHASKMVRTGAIDPR